MGWQRQNIRGSAGLYTELVYQPMIELLHHLRVNGFKTYIVSGLGQDFMRIYAQQVYGIPPEQVLGSSVLTKYQIENGIPALMREPPPRSPRISITHADVTQSADFA
jgi:hypothetical protein